MEMLFDILTSLLWMVVGLYVLDRIVTFVDKK
jgi:hypothetical protein